MIKLYEYGPTRAARCLWTLRELGIDFESVEVDLTCGAHREDAYLAVNPMGRVPTLDVDGEVITESLAICTWLADRFSEKGLIPPCGTLERAQHDRWMFFCATELDAPLWRIRRNTVLLPDERRVAEDVPLASDDFQAAAGVLEKELGPRSFLVGDRFTVADIAMTHTLFWSTWNGLLEGSQGLEAYMNRHLARPACPDVMRRS